MNIAVVDDLEADRGWLAQNMQKYMHGRGLTYHLHEFSSGESFLASQALFDIVFMDIYMGGMTGMEAALALRRRDRDCKLVFLTTTEHYLRQGYSVGASHYLLKPASEEEFAQAMENCRIKPRYDVELFEVTVGGKPCRIDTTKLLYIDVSGHNTRLHMTEGVISVAASFAAVTEPLLCDRRFLLCIKGVLLNMDSVLRLEDSVFALKNGERLQIALRGKKGILQAYHEYSFRKMGGAV